jgi:hypothetical protein
MTETRDALVIAQLSERLRQEQELFDQRKAQDKRQFLLWMVMGWTAVMLFIAICAFCGFVVLNFHHFSSGTVTAATSALLVEALGLVIAVWKIVLGKGPRDLEPTATVIREIEDTPHF